MEIIQQNKKDQTSDKMNAISAEIVGPGRMGTKIEGLDDTSPSSDELKAEGSAHESKATRHHKAAILYPLVLAQMHFDPLLVSTLSVLEWISSEVLTLQTGQFTQSQIPLGHFLLCLYNSKFPILLLKNQENSSPKHQNNETAVAVS